MTDHSKDAASSPRMFGAERAIWSVFDESDDRLLLEAFPGAAELVSRAFGWAVQPASDGPSATIVIRQGHGTRHADGVDPRPSDRRGLDESYRIATEGEQIVVYASSSEGVFRALVTMAWIIVSGRRDAIEVNDTPAWAWRGLSLDVVRRWFPREEVEDIIDLLAVLRMNVLHLHLTDREAWRFPMEGYPALTQGMPHYSTEDLERLVAYARARYVTIIPEVDMPGHVTAAVNAVPGLASDPTSNAMLEYLTWSNPEVPPFVDAAIDQLTAVFDSPFLHIGGDEAFGMPEGEYVEFVRHAVAAVRRRGRSPLGWQETSRAGCWAEGDVVQLWVGTRDRFDSDKAYRTWPEEWHATIPALAEVADQAIGDPGRIADQGALVLVSISDPLYLDRRPAEASLLATQNERLSELGNGDYEPTPSMSLRHWDPLSEPDVRDHGLHIAGLEAAIWCETVASFDDVALLLLPRLALMAEHGWFRDQTDWAAAPASLVLSADVWRRLGFGGFHQSSQVFGPSGDRPE